MYRCGTTVDLKITEARKNTTNKIYLKKKKHISHLFGESSMFRHIDPRQGYGVVQ